MPAEGYDVVAILGQSNALGAGLGLQRRSLDHPDERVHQFAGSGRRKGQVLIAVDPLLHQQRAAGVGFGLTFGKLWADREDRSVLLVPTARGNSGFHPTDGFTWDPDLPGEGNLYEYAVGQIRGALATHPANRLRAILWHQGENDTWHLLAAEYAARLDRLVERLRAEFGTVPFVLGQMNPDRMDEGTAGHKEIDRAHREAPERIPACAFVEGPRGMFNGPDEKLHYNAEGQRELGRRYFAAVRSLLDD